MEEWPGRRVIVYLDFKLFAWFREDEVAVVSQGVIQPYLALPGERKFTFCQT